MVSAYQAVAADIDRLARVYPRDVSLADDGGVLVVHEALAAEASVQAFATELSERLLTSQDKSLQYEVFVRQDPERGFFYPVVRRTAHSVATDTVLGRGFFCLTRVPCAARWASVSTV